MTDHQMYDLFVSYSDADRAWVEGYLLDALDAVGVTVLTEAAFPLGAPRLVEFERAIQQSRYTLLVLSPAYLADLRQFVDLLVQLYGLETATWPLIPLILRPVELPLRLAMVTSLDATDPSNWSIVIERLVKTLGRNIGYQRDWRYMPSAAPMPPCPYPGMIPYTETESNLFFGRDAEVHELLQRLRTSQLFAVVGPSGSGKSSLVFAGLIPALRQTKLFGAGKWLIRTMRPGATPVATLAATLHINDDLTDPVQAISRILATQPSDQHLLLIVDQFEEVFAFGRHDATLFQEILLRLSAIDNCFIIITIRSDFYPDLMAAPLWEKIKNNRFEIMPLRGEALRQAITRPADAVGVYLESALVERLLSEAANEPGSLPLIQETMILLWQGMSRRFIPLSAYEELARGSRSGLAVAIAATADATLDRLQPDQREISRRIFLRLVQFGEGRPDTRRTQSVARLRAASDDPEVFVQTLRYLTESRLLILSSGDTNSEPLVDIAHEMLIAGWPQLQQWQSERREAELIRRRLQLKVDEWFRLGQGSGGLLDAVELAEAEQWLTSPSAVEVGYDEALLAFVQASRAAQRQTSWLQKATARLGRWFKTSFGGDVHQTDLQHELPLTRAIDIDIRLLERCTDVKSIRNAHLRLASGELEGPASALLRSFSRISQDVDTALRQESAYNQRLALKASEDHLNALERELTRSSERYVVRFRPIAVRWRQIAAEHGRTLAETVELRQEIDSPYIIGVPLTAEQEIFVGRTDISLRIEQLLLDRRRPPLLLYGQRRMGKTSLLNNLGRLLPNSIVPLFVDLQGPVSSASDHAGLLYNIARKMVNSAKNQRNVSLPVLTREALADDPFTCFDEWLDDVNQALGQNTALLALDEFETLDDALDQGQFREENVLGMLRNLIQHRPRFKVLLAGSHTLQEFQRWASYLINVQTVELGYLKEDEARQLIERPVKDFGLRYTPDACQRILDLTAGHPFLTQLLCAEVVALKNEQDPASRRLARLNDVEAAVPRALNSGGFFFGDIKHNQVDAASLRLLHFLAAQGEGAVIGKDVLRHYFIDQLDDSLNLLLRRAVFDYREGGYCFQVELIRRWFAK